jgi:organic hydroperoxide reductase OsmC/OhrA
MQDLPHHYRVSADGEATGPVDVSSPGLPDISTAAPAEFGGPGDLWSPETLFAAAIADCFILSFRAISRASRTEWVRLRCDVDAVLDRVDRSTRFTRIVISATLTLPSGGDEAKALRLLEKAERSCLITNSLTAEVHLETAIGFGD